MTTATTLKLVYALAHLVLVTPEAGEYVMREGTTQTYEVDVPEVTTEALAQEIGMLPPHQQALELFKRRKNKISTVMTPAQAIAQAINTNDFLLMKRVAYSKGLSALTDNALRLVLHDIENRLYPEVLGHQVRPLKTAAYGAGIPLGLIYVFNKFPGVCVKMSSTALATYIARRKVQEFQNYASMMALVVQHAKERGIDVSSVLYRTPLTSDHSNASLRSKL